MKFKIINFSDIMKHPNLSLSAKDYLIDTTKFLSTMINNVSPRESISKDGIEIHS